MSLGHVYPSIWDSFQLVEPEDVDSIPCVIVMSVHFVDKVNHIQPD